MTDYSTYYYTVTARVGSFVALSIVPLLPSEFRWLILAAALFTFAITIATEEAESRKRVAIACVVGPLVTGAIALLTSSFVVQAVLVVLLLPAVAVSMFVDVFGDSAELDPAGRLKQRSTVPVKDSDAE